jgi:DNA mismatch repair protein MutS2
VSLAQKTMSALDWPVVLETLSTFARTPMGRRAALGLEPLPSVSAIDAAFDLVAEVADLEAHGCFLSTGDVADIGDLVDRATKGAVLEVREARDVGRSLDAMVVLARNVRLSDREAPRMKRLVEQVQPDDGVVAQLRISFDDTGSLSAKTWPELGELRERIGSLHAGIRRTLDDLVRGDQLGDILQDRYVTQRGDRYVIPIKIHAKRWDIGIVHGTSGSGQTAFIEPHQVVELNNHLRIAEGQLEALERRILSQLSGMIARAAPSIQAALAVVIDIDLACARAGLARRLDANRPKVGEDGVIALKSARHPVLMLREVKVVANDLAIGGQSPALVLSGPNTGGKTIALKTIGVCAELVRYGCFVPAAVGSRVDRFERVLALIGDLQTVHDDLSSFSGHLSALQEMLVASDRASLFLIDEIASGTDPAQGAALAHAILERMLDAGARVVVTTHFARVKGLAAVDSRFSVGAMLYEDGRPTYRMAIGQIGESRAFAIAERSGLETRVVERAKQLMDQGDRSIAETLEALDRERQRVREIERQHASSLGSLEAEKAKLEAREAEIAVRSKELETGRSKEFLDRLDRAERAIGAVVAELQRAPDPRKVEAARATVEALRGVVPASDAAAPAPAAIGVDDWVRLIHVGKIGQVVAVSDKAVHVRTGGVTIRVGRADVEITAPPPPTDLPDRTPKRKSKRRVVADALAQAIRSSTNTLDLRGMRVDEGIMAIEAFLDKSVRSGQEWVFLLHGHGGGALKSAIREWLPASPYVEGWAPASNDQGGDAYSVALLK